MNEEQLQLWPPQRSPRPQSQPLAAKRSVIPSTEKVVIPKPKPRPKRPTMKEKYEAVIIEMKARYRFRIRKWRKSMSGCAWEIRYQDGSVTRWVESPRPAGPMSCAIFLHEVGHHAIGFRTFKPRCLEELKAWEWSLMTMRERGLNVTPAVEKRMHDSLRHAVAKARRRGLKKLPAALLPYL